MCKRIKLILIFLLLGCQFHLSSFDYSYQSLSSLLEKVNKNYEIDKHAACEVINLGGGIYYEDLQAIIPIFPQLIHTEWQKIRKLIAERIGKIEPAASKENILWRNSAETIDDLLNDAAIMAPFFCSLCKEVAQKTNSKANFGPENNYLIKSKKSLTQKVMRDAQEMGISENLVVTKIGDVVRGTIIAKSVDNIPQIMKEIKNYAAKSGGKVFFRNYWEEERQSGYVGIHAKFCLPVIDSKERSILAELQIHLECIMDGSRECVKEREHILYDKCKLHSHFDPVFTSSASKLLYLTALKNHLQL